ncbi:hypothetical protein ACGFX2_39655 [Streptomyces goshikiensis]|uniref:hypothetical protein n=1 Tax=Streptomyces goshikiensis TaxID=1942 RepID=UPI003715F7D6
MPGPGMPDEGNCSVSSLALAVLLLLVLVTLLLAAGIGYVAHRHPALAVPITTAGMAVALVVACLGLIAAR